MRSPLHDHTLPSDAQITNPDIKSIIFFWFQRDPLEWIIPPPGLDAELKTRFEHLVLKARKGELDHWTETPAGCLALVVLLDQFSRNLFRDRPEAFGGDVRARGIVRGVVGQGWDGEVGVVQASAFFVCAVQQEGVYDVGVGREGFARLVERCRVVEDGKAGGESDAGKREVERKWVEMGFKAAEKHLQLLERFGRYPTRNKILGRADTEEERRFLDEYKPSLE
ncbi:hypothetical protein GLAREA_07855 [Glarea lozoyensis ATCC 20868]|uniref:DUF924-domain-containing protein n=2 Tax=Glarea lozoyensis TaxID=101852 RepID=S3DKY9_GLAL2|nr:uncharacterized protein GLAREA_07855 [Glarea lozoyensis ATCC 20868]EHK96964.1 hypothetical protein M7I_7289 [Glarea lozoyensis 74030]EPE32721.1 hypothetical protein GLAREA_07855 [Glarea lozoyensis ATCC 20868]